MKIIVNSIIAGPFYSFQPGQIADVEEKLGKVLVDGGYAEEIKSTAWVEVGPVEHQKAMEIIKPKKRR